MTEIAEAAPLPVDEHALLGWLDAKGVGSGPIEGQRLLSGGTQNVLLRFSRGGEHYVLRRPPLHLRQDSNEAMRREARVLAALADSDVPHPRLIAACDDETVLGASFYVMAEVNGVNITTRMNEAHRLTAAQYAMGLAMADALAALGRIDFRAAGLDGFGKPDSYLERQVARWRKQVQSYAQFEAWPGPAQLPHLDAIEAWLDRNRPAQSAPGILHGDFHIANVMFAPDAPRLAAVIDWELATIGDPLLDLGWLLATWPGSDGEPMAPIFSVAPWHGFPAQDELIERYRQGSTRDLSAIDWYVVLACYKLGILLEGTYARSCGGKAEAGLGARMHQATLALLERAARRMAG
jgi:aminoglycoside phosphotransferase (APT) family kinase protein